MSDYFGKRLREYIEEGAKAKRDELDESACPYGLGQPFEYHAWLAGFRDEKKPS